MRLNENGQITIPEAIRQQAGLHPGCDIEFHVENGRVWLAPNREEASLQRRRIHALIEQVAGSANANLDLGTGSLQVDRDGGLRINTFRTRGLRLQRVPD